MLANMISQSWPVIQLISSIPTIPLLYSREIPDSSVEFKAYVLLKICLQKKPLVSAKLDRSCVLLE